MKSSYRAGGFCANALERAAVNVVKLDATFPVYVRKEKDTADATSDISDGVLLICDAVRRAMTSASPPPIPAAIGCQPNFN